MIYKAQKEDAQAVASMAIIMWKNHSLEELRMEFEEIIANKECTIFIYAIENQPVGFAQCQLRHDYVEGTKSSPVGYLEGIFINEEYRKQGCAKELLTQCEEWAKEQGCLEFASDCELTNDSSFEFHKKMGFTETNRIICFTKQL